MRKVCEMAFLGCQIGGRRALSVEARTLRAEKTYISLLGIQFTDFICATFISLSRKLFNDPRKKVQIFGK